MERSAIEILLELSSKQLQAAEEEDWVRFEWFLTEKEKIYSCLSKKPFFLSEKDKKILEVLKIKEKMIKDILRNKRKEIIDHLNYVKGIRRAIKGYKPSCLKIKLPRFLSRRA